MQDSKYIQMMLIYLGTNILYTPISSVVETTTVLKQQIIPQYYLITPVFTSIFYKSVIYK